MRPRPWYAALALLALAFLHLVGSLRLLLAGEPLVGGAQVVLAGGFVFAAVAAAHAARASLAVGFAIAAGVVAVRVVATAADASPFAAGNGLLAAGLALAAWGAWRLAHVEDARGALALRGGGALMAAGYGAFGGLAFALGASPLVLADFAARAIAALAFAAMVDAPALAERKPFGPGPASADG
ncbi:MAG TPA: hypothetical protein VM582_03585 [Candidatus Thermoplasmatota archaeon]|nr:hypothetical protein [Candidatus Thermoplasmatota archaeon]